MVRYIYLTILALALTPSAWGFEVSPISAKLDISRHRSHLITITSRDKKQIPIKVSAVSWALTKEGRDIRKPTSDIILFPGQFVLSPNDRRVIRVGTRIKTKPAIEKSYRIMVKEVPVALQQRQGTESGVRFLTAYATAFYITPQNPDSDVQLQSVETTADGLILKLFNNGNAHTHLFQLTLTLSQDGKTANFDKDKYLPHFLNENLLAKSERDFLWKWPSAVPKSIDLKRPFGVELTFQCESCDKSVTALTYSVP